MPFKLNRDSLDQRDAKMPPELVKAFYDLSIQSILDVGCGSGWLYDYLPPGTRYVGFDKNPVAIENAKKLHSGGHFIVATIESIAADIKAALRYTQGDKFDAAFFKCIFCVIDPTLVPSIMVILKEMVAKYVLLYDTEKHPFIWMQPFTEAGFQLIFNHKRGGAVTEPKDATYYISTKQSDVQVWRISDAY